MLKTILGFFQGPSGEGSSKRISGLSCIAAGIVRAFQPEADPALVLALLGSGMTLLGVAAITHT